MNYDPDMKAFPFWVYHSSRKQTKPETQAWNRRNNCLICTKPWVQSPFILGGQKGWENGSVRKDLLYKHESWVWIPSTRHSTHYLGRGKRQADHGASLASQLSQNNKFLGNVRGIHLIFHPHAYTGKWPPYMHTNALENMHIHAYTTPTQKNT